MASLVHLAVVCAVLVAWLPGRFATDDVAAPFINNQVCISPFYTPAALQVHYPLNFPQPEVVRVEEVCLKGGAIEEAVGTDNDRPSFRYSFDEWYELTAYQTEYQLLEMYEDPVDHNRCLILDNVIQICTSYEHHYTDVYVHVPVAFLSSFETALIIGGGDALALREVLRYKSVRQAVQLELDIDVPLVSEQYFEVNAHLGPNADPRVEWVFGDAAATLDRLFSRGDSFDLIVVDISETGMSATVSTNDFFDKLAKLLSPHGILIKNEEYHSPLADMFEEYLELKYEVPTIQEQIFSIGSNGTLLSVPNFQLMKDNGIEPRYITPEAYAPLVKRYHSRSAIDGERFVHPANFQLPTPQKALGTHLLAEITMVENVDVLKNATLTEHMLQRAVEAGNLTLLKLHAHQFHPEGVTGFAVLAESHISIHTWPEYQYAMVDILTCGDKAMPRAAMWSIGETLAGLVEYREAARGLPTLASTPV